VEGRLGDVRRRGGDLDHVRLAGGRAHDKQARAGGEIVLALFIVLVSKDL
jgi:hypothetical protein